MFDRYTHDKRTNSSHNEILLSKLMLYFNDKTNIWPKIHVIVNINCDESENKFINIKLDATIMATSSRFSWHISLIHIQNIETRVSEEEPSKHLLF